MRFIRVLVEWRSNKQLDDKLRLFLLSSGCRIPAYLSIVTIIISWKPWFMQ